MSSIFHFKLPKKQTKQPLKQQKNIFYKPRQINQRLLSLKYRKQIENNANKISLREMEEWIFDDQKIITDHYRLINRKSVISLEKSSNSLRNQKLNQRQYRIQPELRFLNNQVDNQIKLFQLNSRKTKQLVRISPTLSRHQTIKQSDLKLQKSQNHKISHKLTPKSNKSSKQSRRDIKNTKSNFAMYFNLNVLLKKGDSLLKVKKTVSCPEQKINSPKTQIAAQQKTLKVQRSNSEREQDNSKREKFRQKKLSLTMGLNIRNEQRNALTDRQKFTINAWEVNSPLSPDLFGIHRYKCKNMQLVPITSEVESSNIT